LKLVYGINTSRDNIQSKIEFKGRMDDPFITVNNALFAPEKHDRGLNTGVFTFVL